MHLFQYTWARPPSPSICYEFQTVAIRSMRLLNSLKTCASLVQGVLLPRTILLSRSSINTKRQIQWFRSNHLEIFSSNFLYHDMSASVPGRLSSISFGMDQCLFIVIMTGITICDWQVWLGLLMFWSIRLGNHKKTKDSGARRPRAVFLVSSSFEVGKVWYEKFCTRTIAVFFKVESTEIHTLKNPQICN